MYDSGVLADAPVQKDVVIAGVGVGAALGGFVLVFLGVVLAGISSLTGDTPAAVLKRYKVAGFATLGVFLLTLVSTLTGLLWLFSGGGSGFYELVIGLFILALASIGGVAIWVTVTLVLG